jgi:hypothetical protein
MMVVRLTDLCCALTAPFILCMPSLNQILLVNFGSNVDYLFSLICKRQDDITLIK